MKLFFETILSLGLILLGIGLGVVHSTNEPNESDRVLVCPIPQRVILDATYSVKDTLAQFILLHEGELVKHPADPGGLTNKGVTWSSFKLFSNLCEYDATPETFFKMPDSVWMEIFMLHWNVFDGLESKEIQAFCTDYIWGSGTKGKLEIQRVIQKFIPSQPITGYIGRETIDNMNSIPEQDLYNALYKNRVKFLNGIEYKHYFIRGWMKRVKHLDRVLNHAEPVMYAQL